MEPFIVSPVHLFLQQLLNFAATLPDYATILDYSAEELTETVNDAAFLGWLIHSDTVVSKHSLEFTNFQLLARTGNKGVTTVLTVPAAVVYTTMPTLVAPGIQKRFATKAAKAKANPLCTKAMQLKMGIAPKTGSGLPTLNPPDLRLEEEAGFVKVMFHKYGHSAANLYRDKGDGKGYGTEAYKTLQTSPFFDKDLPVIGLVSMYKYKMVYLDKDIENGNFCGDASINVTGR